MTYCIFNCNTTHVDLVRVKNGTVSSTVEKEARIRSETQRINKERKEQKKAEKEKKRKEYEAKLQQRQKEENKKSTEEKISDCKSGKFVCFLCILRLIKSQQANSFLFNFR